MATRHENRERRQAVPSVQRSDVGQLSAAARRLRIELLECQVEALERELEIERERRQAVVDRYERLLDER
jgi:hypothetical protein